MDREILKSCTKREKNEFQIQNTFIVLECIFSKYMQKIHVYNSTEFRWPFESIIHCSQDYDNLSTILYVNFFFQRDDLKFQPVVVKN